MLDTGLSFEEAKRDLRSVSPLSSHHGSRSSTPGISSLDGTLRQSFASPPPPRPQSSPPTLEMAIQPATFLAFGIEPETKVKAPLVDASQDEALPEFLEMPVEQPAVTLEVPAQDLPSLSHVARILRLQKYQRRRCQELRSHLHGLQVATARTARLLTVTGSIQRNLAECIRCEDKNSFVSLFNAFQDAVDDCRQLASEPAGKGWSEPEESSLVEGSFLDRLQKPTHAIVTDFLTAIRYDGDFIADRLASLTPKEVLSLLPDRGSVRSAESIFGSTSGLYSRTSRQLGYVVDSQMELLSSQAFGSTLETLVHCMRSGSKASISEDSLAFDTWSTVCARLVSEQKQGSEKLVPAVLDIWASPADWPGKARLRQWILQTLQSGSFLTEQSSKQSFRMRVQGRPEVPAEEEIRSESFYSRAVGELLDLLADLRGASVIPESVLKMCRAIWTKLQPYPGHQRAFPHFVLTRWLFSPFFIEAISLPEAFNLMPDHFISDIARQRLLREVVNRAQKAAYDVAYLWKHGNVVSAETTSRVQAIMNRFRGQHVDITATPLRPRVIANDATSSEHTSFFVVSATDVTRMVRALYPQRRPASFSSGVDTIQSGLRSSASSISGFSLFKHAGSLDASPYPMSLWPQDVLQGLKTDSGKTGLASHSSVSAGRVEHPSASLDLAHDQIWEACASIEDLLEADIPLTYQWTTLVALAGDQELQSMRNHLRDPLDETDLQPTEHENAAQSAACTLLLEQILLECQDDGLDVDQRAAYDLYLDLVDAIERHLKFAEETCDFVGAHEWFQNLQFLCSLCAEDPNLNLLRTTIQDMVHLGQRSLTRDAITVGACEDWLRLAKPPLEANLTELSCQVEAAEQLRDTMWFVADVRTSAAYDEARSVSGALRIMGKPKKPPRTRIAPPLRHWSGSKLSNTSFHLKTEVQYLELMSALPDQGGPNKLSDDQSRCTLSWMERNSIENLCRGEERLHRLCMEVRKCVDQLTSEDGALLSSNPLFARESHNVSNRGTSRARLSALQGSAGRLNQLTLQTNVASSIDSISSSSHALSSASSRDYMYLESRSPTLTHKSSAPFWSPAITEAQSPSSATSIGSYHTQTAPRARRRHNAAADAKDLGSHRLERLKRRLTGLLLSDLMSTLFNDGSETDRAFWTGLGGELVDKHLRAKYVTSSNDNEHGTAEIERTSLGDRSRFDYDQAFHQMLGSFSASSDPSTKLATLFDINRLMSLRASEQRVAASLSTRQTGLATTQANVLRKDNPSLKVEDNVPAFCRLFCDAQIRPPAIFRDLQTIAALVPVAVLESTPQGKAFWNAAVAVSQLKREARNIMVETADSIIAYHSNNRGHGRSSSTAQQQRDSATFTTPSRTSSAEEIARYSMADAAYLLQITAKEGDPVAQRELATLYLTHPELMDHIIAPFARPKDVFKEELESKWRKNQDRNRCDPATMCVAHHWMSLSSRGGDALATEYLRAREEMERLP